MNWKVGDKLMCKLGSRHLNLKVGREYTIFRYWEYGTKKYYIDNGPHRVSLHFSDHKINKYFYSIKELRKEKLDKINKKNRK